MPGFVAPMLETIVAVAGVLLAFAAARWLSARLGHPPWASPVLLASILVAVALALLAIPVASFVGAAQPLRWLLGPALVALALVIHGNLSLLRRSAAPVLLAIAGGAAIGIGSAIAMARLLGFDRDLVMALATKTVSTPFAVAIAKSGGGPVALAAALAVLTGVVGALAVPLAFDALRITGSATRALGLGVSSHIVGTDWLTRRDPASGALSALAMVIAGALATLVLPLLWRFIFAA